MSRRGGGRRELRPMKQGPTVRKAAGSGLPVSVCAVASAAAVGLVTARRGGMGDKEFGTLARTTIEDVTMAAARGREAEALGFLVGQLAHMTAVACDGWDKAAGDSPSTEYLITGGLMAARAQG